MLKFIIIYLIIGLVLELILNGKKTIEDIRSKRYSVAISIFGTVVMSFLTPVYFVYGLISGLISHNKEGESR